MKYIIEVEFSKTGYDTKTHGKLTLDKRTVFARLLTCITPRLDFFKATGSSIKGICEFMIKRIYYQAWYKEQKS